jgi:solute carrier family 6 amino acid transporter-like protein 5/7/9/14
LYSKVYGIHNLVNDIQINLGFEPNLFFRFTWKFLCPIIVITLMILSLTYSDQLKYGDYVYPLWSIIFGWCLNMAFILPIPIVIIYVFIRYSDSKHSLKERICFLFTPTITKRRLGPPEYQTTWLEKSYEVHTVQQ